MKSGAAAAPCANCHGKGVVVPDWGREHPDSPPCPECAPDVTPVRSPASGDG